MIGPRSLPEALIAAARRQPERGIALFDNRGRPAGRRTYPELYASARRSAGMLRALGVEAGDRVLIGLPTSWSFLESWLGALLLGAWPAALAPAGALGSSETQLRKVGALVRLVDARLLIAGDALRQELLSRPELCGAQVLSGAELAALAAEPPPEPVRAEPDEVAFLQFTSGSTGLPRAVMISHRAALHNARAIDRAIGAPYGSPAGEWADSLVAWLPMHHDMGLIGCLFLSITLALELSLMSPIAFLARPRRWLELLGAGGSTISHAPNFGYQLCVERISPAELSGLDLSGWRSAINGAEMVRPETTGAFCELTGGCGFRPDAFRPCYGLAEATVAVTVDVRGEGVRSSPIAGGDGTGPGAGDVVCLGAPVDETELLVCAPDGSPLPDGGIGEVRVRGSGIFDGYYNDPAATADALQDGWLRTGDLGFLRRGELYLTGRLKDLLIIHGENVMPHELEWIAEAVVAGGGSCRAGAFAVVRGAAGEQAVVVVESQESDPRLLFRRDREIRSRIGRELSLPLADLVFVRRGAIPRTTSGKVQRQQLGRCYRDGRLERLAVGGDP